jgi:hypothetical protein
MACILLTEPIVAGVKTELLREYREIDEIKSSHLSEALARAAGFNTHAALLATLRDPLRKPAPEDDYRLLDYEAFRLRLGELTGLVIDEDGWDEFELGDYPGLIATHYGYEDIEYKTERKRAWRNIMVAGINAGLAAGLFTIRPGDNRWAGANNRNAPNQAHVTFDLAPGLPALAWFSDAGYEELNVGVTVNPTDDTIRLHHGSLDFHFGDATAQGWLERKTGAWLQSATTRFKCRQKLQQKLATLSVRPRCFGDFGRVIM